MARIHPVNWFRGLVWTSSPAKLNAFGGNKKGKKDKTWFHIIPENFTTGLLGHFSHPKKVPFLWAEFLLV